jgi:hypothetical protein
MNHPFNKVKRAIINIHDSYTNAKVPNSKAYKHVG